MIKVSIFALIVFVAISTVIPHVPPIYNHIPILYNVSLDDSPEDRWRQIIHDYEQPLKKFMDYFQLLPIPNKFFEGVEWYAKNVFKHQDFVAQVEAVAKLSGYPFQQIFFLNFMSEYATFKACSGILIRNQAGRVMHGRNLDFQMWNLLSRLVVKMDYYRGKQRIFSVDAIVGSVFALTGIRHGAFAINADTRKADHFYNNLISTMLDDGMPIVWLIRKVLEQQYDYQRAVKRLKYERIGSPVYYIISGVGPDQGMVIQRDTNSVHAYYQLSEQNWFIVQTNYDREYPDPMHDPRRVPVEKRLRQKGNSHFQEQNLFDEFMTVWPTFNIATIMTSIMVPSSGYHNTTVWYAQNPTPTV